MMIAIPDGCSISPLPAAARLMPSWTKRYPSPRCDGTHSHDFKLQSGIGCLLICRHCGASGSLTHGSIGTA